jgi:hypothetical protein
MKFPWDGKERCFTASMPTDMQALAASIGAICETD